MTKTLKLKITFLGTGTSHGIPMINSTNPVCLSTNRKDKRLRASILVQWANYTYVIDCGGDFRYQMLRANVTSIDGIIFTHEHSDHVAGLDDIRPYCFQMGTVPIYAQQRVLDSLTQRYTYIFKTQNRYLGAASVTCNIIENQPFKIKNMNVIPIEVMHGDLPILGYRFEDFAYLTDVKIIDSVNKEKLKGLKVLVLNALRYEPHFSHLNIEEALELVQELQPERTYFTHISHMLGFHDIVEAALPKNVFLAYDELEIEM